MLPGSIASVNKFKISSIFNVNGRVGMTYGNSIAEMIALNKIAVSENTIEDVSSFEDSIGTIPLVNNNQPIGLILDKSFKLQRGLELIAGTNIGAFSVKGSSSNTPTSITTTAANSGVTTSILTVGKWYEIVISYSDTSTSELSVNVYDSVSETERLIRVGEGRAIFRAEYTSLYLKHSTNGITNGIVISLKELPGHHLIQDTPLDRPILSYRVNRVDSSEDLTGLAWTNDNVLIETGLLAPDGTLSAFGLQNTISSVSKLTQSNTYFLEQSGQYLRTIFVKPGTEAGATIIFEGVGDTILNSHVGFNTLTLNFTLSTGLLDDYGHDELDDGWLFVWMKISADADKIVSNNIYVGNQAGTAVQHEVIVWHPDTRLEIHDTARLPDYQATYADTTIETAGFLPYIDVSTDKYLRTYVDLVAADKFLVMSSFTVLSNVDSSIYLEYGTDSDVDDGSFSIRIPETLNSDALILTSRGNVQKSSIHYFPEKLPLNFSLFGFSDLSAPELRLTINKINKPDITSTQGVGNLSSRPLFLFGRNGDSMFGKFHVYMLPTLLFMNNSDSGLSRFEMNQLKKLSSLAIKS